MGNRVLVAMPYPRFPFMTRAIESIQELAMASILIPLLVLNMILDEPDQSFAHWLRLFPLSSAVKGTVEGFSGPIFNGKVHMKERIAVVLNRAATGQASIKLAYDAVYQNTPLIALVWAFIILASRPERQAGTSGDTVNTVCTNEADSASDSDSDEDDMEESMASEAAQSSGAGDEVEQPVLKKTRRNIKINTLPSDKKWNLKVYTWMSVQWGIFDAVRRQQVAFGQCNDSLESLNGHLEFTFDGTDDHGLGEELPLNMYPNLDLSSLTGSSL
jgi:hypothetical protein